MTKSTRSAASTAKTPAEADLYPLVPPNLLLMPKEYFDWAVDIDLHGTIVDWTTPFCRFASAQLKRDINPSSMTVYFPGYDARSGMNNAEFNALFYHFVRVGGYGDLCAYAGAVDALHQLNLAGFHLRISTWTPGPFELSRHSGRAFGSGRAQEATLALVRQLNLPIEEGDVQFVHGREKPFNMLEKARKIPLLIDDSPSTAVSTVSEYGAACFLIDQPYNRTLKCQGITRFASLAEAAPKVVEFFSTLEMAGVMRPRF